MIGIDIKQLSSFPRGSMFSFDAILCVFHCCTVSVGISDPGRLDMFSVS